MNAGRALQQCMFTVVVYAGVINMVVRCSRAQHVQRVVVCWTLPWVLCLTLLAYVMPS